MFVLGIDPGLSRCGYGVIEISQRKESAIAAGVITTLKTNELPNRLLELRNELRDLIEEFSPEVIAVERVLFQRNVMTAISVGQVIGIVLVEGLDAGCEVIEYSPNEIKLAVAGHGGADKTQMEEMVRTLLKIIASLKIR